MFTDKDFIQIKAQGISIQEIEKQLFFFKNGFPFVNLSKPVVPDDGIIRLNADEEKKYIEQFESYSKQHKLLKFVPASGAATRMFKDLYSFVEGNDNIEKYPSVKQVVENINKFAFYDELKSVLNKNRIDINNAEPKTIIEYILFEKGLNYGSLPKALLLFHKYSEGSRTSMEEHLVEGALYSTSYNNEAFLHFTVSPEHQNGFETLLNQKMHLYKNKYQIHYNVSFSNQLSSTDTIAVDLNNEPFRDKNGKLVFRPAGHGALINNLNQIDADLIFIKNIDNVVPDKLKESTVIYKKAIAGLLVFLQQKIFEFQEAIDHKKLDIIPQIRDFYKLYFHLNISPKEEEIKKILFRPIRVCGMVKNEGEPGGGPFWIRDDKNNESLQIVESSQINMNNAKQVDIFKSATHFNPVDLVCSIKNYKGEKYNLLDFVDTNTGFISQKSKDGKPLKAMELPGLWNGAMAHWNTIFVEVPIITFNPVKTINDLLRPQHLNYTDAK